MQNEKRKDKDLTLRIAKLLKARDEVMKGANIGTNSLFGPQASSKR